MEPFKIDVHIPPRVTRLMRDMTPQGQFRILGEMGRSLACRFGRFFAHAARSRHKTAERFGVKPTGILEFTDTYPPRSRGGGEITARRDGRNIALRITGVPFLGRAFGPVRIEAKRAHCLTIPINRASVHRSAAEMESIGYVLFSKRRKRGGMASGILYGRRGNGRPVPLFALVRSVTLPRDAHLMPSEARVCSWAAESARRAMGI